MLTMLMRPLSERGSSRHSSSCPSRGSLQACGSPSPTDDSSCSDVWRFRGVTFGRRHGRYRRRRLSTTTTTTTARSDFLSEDASIEMSAPFRRFWSKSRCLRKSERLSKKLSWTRVPSDEGLDRETNFCGKLWSWASNPWSPNLFRHFG